MMNQNPLRLEAFLEEWSQSGGGKHPKPYYDDAIALGALAFFYPEYFRALFIEWLEVEGESWLDGRAMGIVVDRDEADGWPWDNELRPFIERFVQSHPMASDSGSSRVRGVPCHCGGTIITETLRGREPEEDLWLCATCECRWRRSDGAHFSRGPGCDEAAAALEAPR